MTGQDPAGRDRCDGDCQSPDALDVVSGGGGAEGHASKVRTGFFAWTVVEEDRRMPSHLLQWGHREDILQARAVIRSAVASIGCSHDCHGRVVLSGRLLVTLLGQSDGGGTMRSPVVPRSLEVARRTGSNKNNAKGVILLQGLLTCVNPTWGLLPPRKAASR